MESILNTCVDFLQAISFMYREHDYMMRADDEWNDGSHLISRRVRRSNPAIDTTSPSSYHKSKHHHKCATKTSGNSLTRFTISINSSYVGNVLLCSA